jgi:hypothetical protein
MKAFSAIISSQRGFVRSIFIIAIVVIAIYVGFQFGVPYYKYSAFKNDVKEIARLGLAEGRTKAQVLETAQGFKIPIDEKDIVVTRKADRVRVETEWTDQVDVLGLYQKTLQFTVLVEE